MDITIGVHVRDIKLMHWIKNTMGHGSVKIVNTKGFENIVKVARFTITSKKSHSNTMI
jgi:hypothetical protein